MKPDWILIANATQARLLQKERGGPLVVLKSFSHPQSRSKASELADDRAGQERTDRSFGAAAYQPRLDPKRKEHLHFARELADHLEQQAQQGNFRSLELFAGSPFLGELRAALGDTTNRLLREAHDLDLTAVGLAEMERRISHELQDNHGH